MLNWMICGQATRHCVRSQDNQFPDNGRIDFNLLEISTNPNTLQVNTICTTSGWFIARYGKKCTAWSCAPNVWIQSM